MDETLPEIISPKKASTKEEQHRFIESLMNHALYSSSNSFTQTEILINLLQTPPDQRSISTVHLIKQHFKHFECFKDLNLGDEFL